MVVSARAHSLSRLPYRGTYGDSRPIALQALALPPRPMPPRLGSRPLKAWRYVGVFGPEFMISLATIRIGPVRQSFWAVWDREERRLYQRTDRGPGAVRLGVGSAAVADRDLRLVLTLEEVPGIETVCASGEGYAWTRKQGGIPVRGTIAVGPRAPTTFEAGAVVDDTAAYYKRHTHWRWSAGVGTSDDGRAVAWNLVDGVNDPPRSSERTVWVDGSPCEVGPVRFAPDLSSVGGLAFVAEASRDRAENRLLVRSRYRQPFGTFSGELPGAVRLANGYGVMEEHDVWW